MTTRARCLLGSERHSRDVVLRERERGRSGMIFVHRA